MTINGGSGRVSHAYIQRLRGAKRGPLPEPERAFGLPDRLRLTCTLVGLLALLAALAWLLALGQAS